MDDRRVPTDLAALPKAEVHVHLEGSVRPATLDELCHRGRYVVPRTFHDLNGFIHAVSAAWTTMMQPGDYARLVREYCEDAARAGIRYAEVELVPGGRPYDCLGEAVEAASRQPDVEPAPRRRPLARRSSAAGPVGVGRAGVGQHRRPGVLRLRPGRRVRDRGPAARARPRGVCAARAELGGEYVRARGGQGRLTAGDRRLARRLTWTARSSGSSRTRTSTRRRAGPSTSSGYPTCVARCSR